LSFVFQTLHEQDSEILATRLGESWTYHLCWDCKTLYVC